MLFGDKKGFASRPNFSIRGEHAPCLWKHGSDGAPEHSEVLNKGTCERKSSQIPRFYRRHGRASDSTPAVFVGVSPPRTHPARPVPSTNIKCRRPLLFCSSYLRGPPFTAPLPRTILLYSFPVYKPRSPGQIFYQTPALQLSLALTGSCTRDRPALRCFTIVRAHGFAVWKKRAHWILLTCSLT